MYFINNLSDEYKELYGSYRYIQDIVATVISCKYKGLNTQTDDKEFPVTIWTCPNCNCSEKDGIKNIASLIDSGQCIFCDKYSCEIGSLYIDFEQGVLLANDLFYGIKVVGTIKYNRD